jgi:6-phosphofructokinase 1
MSKKRYGLLTGGGDVQPLNALISSMILTSNENNIELIGFYKGWQGLLDNEYVNLNHKTIEPLIGGTILKSSRINIAKYDDAISVINENLKTLSIEGLIVIGGEDTLSNSLYLDNIPQILISKTIDNDVGIISKSKIMNYFTLGFPTAAEIISRIVSLNYGLRTTAYSHERIIVVESMGMHAGWLALSSIMGDPDFIIIPEFNLKYSVFVSKVLDKFLEQKNLIIVISEGAKWENGEYISADYSETDNFGHPRFIGSAQALAKKLKKDLSNYFDTRNINFVNPSYLYRSGMPNRIDSNGAYLLGKYAVKSLSNKSAKTFLFTDYDGKELCISEFDVSRITDIEKLHRFVPNTFYDNQNYTATLEAKSYLSKFLSELPKLNYAHKVT